MAILMCLGSVLAFLILAPIYFRLSKIFQVLKILTAISFLLPILLFAWLMIDPPQIEDAAYLPNMVVLMFAISIACIGGLAFAWVVAYVYWLYAKKNNLLEISSFYVALMLIAAIVGGTATPILLLSSLFDGRY